MFNLKESLFTLLFLVHNVLLFDWLTFLRSNSIGNQFYYSQIKRIINKYSNLRKYNLIHSFHLLLYAFYIVRFLSIMFNFNFLSTGDESVDFFSYFFSQFSTEKDAFYLFPMIGVLLFALLVEPLLYFSPSNTITWQKYFHLIIVNADAYTRFEADQRRHRTRKVSRSFRGKILKCVSFNWPTIEASRSVFYLTKLQGFTTISPKLRFSFVQANFLMSKLCKLLIIALCKFE